MTIWISSLARAPDLAKQHKPGLIVSLLSPYDAFPTFETHGDDRHLKVAIHDITQDYGDWEAPKDKDVDSLIAFVERWDRQSPMLIHCWAGISRSTASAFITACMHNPGADEAEIARAIRDASPTASPNRRIVALADAALGRGGRMTDAIETIGRGMISEEATPFFIPSSYGLKAQ